MNRIRLAPRWAAALIVMVAAGCDNVQWGGADVAVVTPPPRAGDAAADPAADPIERLPNGPVLYYVRSAGGQASMIPVAELLRDTVLPIRAHDWTRYGQLFIDQHLRRGAEFALFHHGGRVGTFVLESAGVPDETVCPRLPFATGFLELMPGASELPEFLALAKPNAPPGAPRGVVALPEAPPRTRSMAPILAERLLRARRAPLPGNWTRAMAPLAPFPLSGSELPAFASTFILGDSLGVGPAETGYALFFIAQPMPQIGYDTIFADFVNYEFEGKAAPRVVDFLDLNRDEQVDLVLEVYGEHGSWFEVVQAADGEWRRLLENPCPAPPPNAPGQQIDSPGS